LRIQPQVLGACEGAGTLTKKGTMLLPTDLVYGLLDMPHEVEAVEDHLTVGVRDVFPDGEDVRLPDVQGDPRKACQLFGSELLEESVQALLLAVR